ncbi:MAG: hypothetical protein R6W70_05320 [bacterium]
MFNMRHFFCLILIVFSVSLLSASISHNGQHHNTVASVAMTSPEPPPSPPDNPNPPPPPPPYKPDRI